jgi:hypothetical protein
VISWIKSFFTYEESAKEKEAYRIPACAVVCVTCGCLVDQTRAIYNFVEKWAYCRAHAPSSCLPRKELIARQENDLEKWTYEPDKAKRSTAKAKPIKRKKRSR